MRKYVWRVETLGGKGPYENDAPAVLAHDRMKEGCSEIRHPTPHRDTLLKDEWYRCVGWQFGFRSLKQYLSWFYTKGAREVLNEKGTVLRKYAVSAEYIIYGDKQLVFSKEHASLVEERACNFI